MLERAIIYVLLIIEYNGEMSTENLKDIFSRKSQNRCTGNMMLQVVEEGHAKFPCSQLCQNSFKIARQTSSPQLPA